MSVSSLKRFLFLFLIAASTGQVFAQARIPVKAKHGMVVSDQYLASEVGRDILKQGGSAIDASVATAFALAVTLPGAGNIGGGGFLVYRAANGEATTFNFREKAPLAASREMYLDENGKIKDNSNHDGILAVGVPGTVSGLYKAHQEFGKLEWRELLQPAIDLAENGFKIDADIAGFSAWLLKNKDKYPSTAKTFLKDQNTALQEGDTLIQKDLANTLKRIQKEGPDGFYKGKTADLLANFMKSNNGIITKKDLQKYETTEESPVIGKYRDYEIIGMPPPSSGGVAIVEMLNILENYNLSETGHNSAASLHLITEAMRRAYADRAQYLGDPDFNPKMPISKLISKEYAQELSNSILEKQASESDSVNFNNAHLKHESSETTHFSVIDSEGNTVSLTYTLEEWYGSKMLVEGAGFLLNNEMGDFNPIPGYTDSEGLIGTPPNLVAPEKQMLSSMSPTIVAKNGKPVIVIGSPGGRTIINTVLQVILNVVDYKMNIAEAIESPRIHHQWLPDVTYFEDYGFSPDTRRIYSEMGYTIKNGGSQGLAMGIYLDPETGIIYGAADSRSTSGEAVGY